MQPVMYLVVTVKTLKMVKYEKLILKMVKYEKLILKTLKYEKAYIFSSLFWTHNWTHKVHSLEILYHCTSFLS